MRRTRLGCIAICGIALMVLTGAQKSGEAPDAGGAKAAQEPGSPVEASRPDPSEKATQQPQARPGPVPEYREPANTAGGGDGGGGGGY